MRTVVTDDLVTWLRAQLDDDEREWLPTIRGARQNGKTFAMRMLREVDAKRRIIDLCAEVIGDRNLSDYDRFGSLAQEPNAMALFLAVETLRSVALPYADRPGYRDEWRPA